MSTTPHTTIEPMDAETLEALRGSIRKWEGIVAGTMVDHGCTNCPLCLKFAEPDDCGKCPVAEHTGQDGCHGTPYYEFEAGDKAGEQRMLDFLKSLLPPDSISDDERTT